MELNEEVRNAKESRNGITLVKEYEDLSKEANRNIINIVDKKDKLLKKIRDSQEFL